MLMIFSRRRALSSVLIRLATWSRWSHVSIVESDTLVIDARLFGGVRHRSLDELLRTSSAVEWRAVALDDEAAALAFARAQIGKRYDWSAIVGFILRAGWADVDKWFCSELAEACIQAGGLRRFRADLARITPGHIWMLV